VNIEYDPAKSAGNIDKYGVPLTFGVQLFDDADHIVLPSARPIDGEDRFKVIGDVEGRLWTAVYIMRERVVRLSV
jgi:uncharacterized protein